MLKPIMPNIELYNKCLEFQGVIIIPGRDHFKIGLETKKATRSIGRTMSNPHIYYETNGGQGLWNSASMAETLVAVEGLPGQSSAL